MENELVLDKGDASIYWKKIQTIYSRQESEFIFLSSPRNPLQ
jgi:hypothetical protein